MGARAVDQTVPGLCYFFAADSAPPYSGAASSRFWPTAGDQLRLLQNPCIPVGVEPDPPVSRNWRDDFHVVRLPVGVEPDPPVSRKWRDDFHVVRVPVGVEPDPPVSRNWRDDFHVVRVPVGVEPDPPVSRNWRDDFHVVRRGSARASATT
jgi:hypothetical protein